MENSELTKKRISRLLRRLEADLGFQGLKDGLEIQGSKTNPSLCRWRNGTTLISGIYRIKLANLLGVSMKVLEEYAAGKETIIDFYRTTSKAHVL